MSLTSFIHFLALPTCPFVLYLFPGVFVNFFYLIFLHAVIYILSFLSYYPKFVFGVPLLFTRTVGNLFIRIALNNHIIVNIKTQTQYKPKHIRKTEDIFSTPMETVFI